MTKISKSDMTREQEAEYDAVLTNMKKARCMHFEPGTFIGIEDRTRGLVLGRARGILWVEWESGDTEMITPMALSWDR